MSPAKFFSELKRREVYKAAVAYAVVAWLLIQVATQVFPFFEIPNWAVQLVVLLLILGFPVPILTRPFTVSPLPGPDISLSLPMPCSPPTQSFLKVSRTRESSSPENTPSRLACEDTNPVSGAIWRRRPSLPL